MADKSRKAMLREFEKIKREGLSEFEFVKARNRMYSQMIFRRYSANGLASCIGECEVVRGDYHRYYELLAEVGTLTQEDIMRAARKYLTEENIKTIYFEPEKGMFIAKVAGFFKMIF